MGSLDFTAKQATTPVLERLDIIERQLSERLDSLVVPVQESVRLRTPQELLPWTLSFGGATCLVTAAIALAAR